MPVRLRVGKEQQLGKVKDLMQMFHLADRNQYQYQPITIGASLSGIDPKNTEDKYFFKCFI